MHSKHNLLIVDGHHFLFKAYGAPFKFYSEKGTPLHTTTVFLSLVRRAIMAVHQAGGCSDIAVVFDRPEETSNNLLSKDYKATRKKDYSKDADSPFHHLPYIQKTLRYLKVKVYEKKGVEADDLIASLATQYIKRYVSGRVFIASSDSDFYQLLSRRVS